MKLKYKKVIYIVLLFICIAIFILYSNNRLKQNENSLDIDIPITDKLISMINQNFISVTSMDSEWIYYSENKSGSSIVSPGGVYRMRHDGTESEQLLDVAARNLILYGEYLYYLDASNYSKLYALSLNDFSTNLILDEIISKFIIADGWIYFYEGTYMEYLSQLSRIKIDGSEYSVLVGDVYSQNLVYQDGYIYFSTLDNLNSTYRISVLNDKVELLSDTHGPPYGIDKNKILTFNHLGLRILDIDTGQSKELLKDNLDKHVISSFNFFNDALYVMNIEEQIIAINQNKNKIVYDELPVAYFNVIGDWLFMSVKENHPKNIQELSLYKINLTNGKVIK